MCLWYYIFRELWRQAWNPKFIFFEIIKLDHFMGFVNYWSIPFEEKTAKNGKWVKGPDMKLINALKNYKEKMILTYDETDHIINIFVYG